LIIYPVPANHTLYIKYTNQSEIEANYSIVNMLGKTVQKGIISGNTIDVSELEKGMYILQLEDHNKKYSVKFMK
jgi:hypothetical protein